MIGYEKFPDEQFLICFGDHDDIFCWYVITTNSDIKQNIHTDPFFLVKDLLDSGYESDDIKLCVYSFEDILSEQFYSRPYIDVFEKMIISYNCLNDGGDDEISN